MAHWKELFSGGNYLAGADFKGKTFTAKIAKVESTSMEDDSGRTKSLPIVTWDINAKPWLMCKTTCYCLAAMYGTDPAMWVGKRVTLYATMVQVGKGEELGVRVKGSPDLPTPIEVEIKLPRKRPFKVKLVNTNTRGPAANGKPTPPPSTPKPPAQQLTDDAEAAQDEPTDADLGSAAPEQAEPIPF